MTHHHKDVWAIMLHYLRIAVTALSLTACVLLIALWVRSYWWHDMVACGFTSKDGIIIDSTNGGLGLLRMSLHGTPTTFVNWKVTSIWSPSEGPLPIGSEESYTAFFFKRLTDGFSLSVPYWFLVLLFAALGTLAYTSRWKRFSLRTLLIATTLVAVALGTVIYFSG
jgi:hypothetical protein